MLLWLLYMMLYVADLLYDGVSLALGSEEGPVAGRDGFVVLSYGHGHGAGEDVQGELLHPLVPVALVELCAVWTKKIGLYVHYTVSVQRVLDLGFKIWSNPDTVFKFGSDPV